VGCSGVICFNEQKSVTFAVEQMLETPKARILVDDVLYHISTFLSDQSVPILHLVSKQWHQAIRKVRSKLEWMKLMYMDNQEQGITALYPKLHPLEAFIVFLQIDSKQRLRDLLSRSGKELFYSSTGEIKIALRQILGRCGASNFLIKRWYKKGVDSAFPVLASLVEAFGSPRGQKVYKKFPKGDCGACVSSGKPVFEGPFVTDVSKEGGITLVDDKGCLLLFDIPKGILVDFVASKKVIGWENLQPDEVAEITTWAKFQAPSTPDQLLGCLYSWLASVCLL
jgi:hypothetical protein